MNFLISIFKSDESRLSTRAVNNATVVGFLLLLNVRILQNASARSEKRTALKLRSQHAVIAKSCNRKLTLGDGRCRFCAQSAMADRKFAAWECGAFLHMCTQRAAAQNHESHC